LLILGFFAILAKNRGFLNFKIWRKLFSVLFEARKMLGPLDFRNQKFLRQIF